MPWPITSAVGLVLVAALIKNVVVPDPNVAWPEKLRWDSILPLTPEQAKQVWWNPRWRPAHDLNAKGALRHSYFQRGPNGHGIATEVTYLPADDVFYINPNCVMGHVDGVLGPFAGDPRVLLDANGALLR